MSHAPLQLPWAVNSAQLCWQGRDSAEATWLATSSRYLWHVMNGKGRHVVVESCGRHAMGEVQPEAWAGVAAAVSKGGRGRTFNRTPV